MKGLRAAGLSDPGRKRENNEDQWFADAARGIFFVIDGVGGQAAGEKAASTACSILQGRLQEPTGSTPQRIREAIALANNEIWREAQRNPQWHGMACVLTAAVVEGDTIHIGQVGDSRLYLIHDGTIRKLTHDHSPVGEREDRGEIDEITAMRHPRRNEVYRDVGTTEHAPDDADFVEISSAILPQNGALLLCSDGLSDLVPSADILQIVEHNAGNPESAARELIQAANDAGGKDNITVIVVETDQFARSVQPLAQPVSAGLKPITGDGANYRKSFFASAPAFLIYGLLLALAGLWLLKPHFVEGSGLSWGAVRQPRTVRVSGDINGALQAAMPGDTVVVAPGSYNEQVRLRDGVSLISERPRGAVLRASAVAVTGEDLRSGKLQGFRIQPDENMYLQTGIQLDSSKVELIDNEISGTVTAGIEMQNCPEATLVGNAVLPRSSAAVVIGGEGTGPRLAANYLVAEGHPAVVINGGAVPVFTGNIFRARDPLFLPPGRNASELLTGNIVLGSEGKENPPARANAPTRIR